MRTYDVRDNPTFVENKVHSLRWLADDVMRLFSIAPDAAYNSELGTYITELAEEYVHKVLNHYGWDDSVYTRLAYKIVTDAGLGDTILTDEESLAYRTVLRRYIDF